MRTMIRNSKNSIRWKVFFITQTSILWSIILLVWINAFLAFYAVHYYGVKDTPSFSSFPSSLFFFQIVKNGIHPNSSMSFQNQTESLQRRSSDNSSDSDSLSTSSPSSTHFHPATLFIKPYTYSNPMIQQQGCLITVILLEPNILEKNVLASLESVAAFVYPPNQTCILIQTSICQYYESATVLSSSEQDQEIMSAYQHVIQSFYDLAGPLLKQRIELGNVRITILNHTKYQLQECNYFYSPSNPWLNYFYWKDYIFAAEHNDDDTSTDTTDIVNKIPIEGEFVLGQDSDFILTIQKDAVLCTILDVYAWIQFSYVGAPWPALDTWWSCTQLIANWNTWHHTSSSSSSSTTTITSSNYKQSKPSYPTQIDFCTNPNIPPMGNGGLSLRSRYWLLQAIYYCPDEILSGFQNVSNTRQCYTTNTGNEDIYFATILRGLLHNSYTIRNSGGSSSSSTPSMIHHNSNHKEMMMMITKKDPVRPLKLPSVLEAAFFATETQWLQDIILHYHMTSRDVETIIETFAWWDGKYDTSSKETNVISSNEIGRKTRVKNKVFTPNVKEEDGRKRFQRLQAIESNSLGMKPFIPIGMHKVWKHAGSDLFQNQDSFDHFLEECPYLKDILPDDDSITFSFQ